MICIIDYGVGNLTSIQNMIKKSGYSSFISTSKVEIENASKILLPGMGHFDNCMIKFNNSGFKDIIERKVLYNKVPVLGICVGLQMFMNSSEEGILPGLGWISGKTVRFRQDKMPKKNKIPNMGWLEVDPKKKSPILNNLVDSRFYFAHSYHVEVEDPNDILLTATYGYEFTAGIEKNNIVGVQFHPEKSHRFGMQFLKNFGDLS